jgi:branched-chain amino acid transport system substrate-binding protein
MCSSLKRIDSQTFLISANAGPSQIAGELCSPFFFSTSWQNDQTPQAMGEYMNQKGVRRYLIGPNYAAGKDIRAGLPYFQGKLSEELTIGPHSSISLLSLPKQRPRIRMRSLCFIQVGQVCSF